MTGLPSFIDSMSKIVLNLLEMGQLKLGEPVERITVIKLVGNCWCI